MTYETYEVLDLSKAAQEIGIAIHPNGLLSKTEQR